MLSDERGKRFCSLFPARLGLPSLRQVSRASYRLAFKILIADCAEIFSCSRGERQQAKGYDRAVVSFASGRCWPGCTSRDRRAA